MNPPTTLARPALRRISASISTLFAMAVLPAFLAACGGSDGSGGPASPVAAAATVNVQGSLVGKYAGATVCSDVNDNGACDAGEASTTTDANGNFSMMATAANLPTVAMIAPNTAFQRIRNVP